MPSTPVLKRLNHRIQRSKRTGKLVLAGVLLVSVVLGSVLVQGLALAIQEDRQGVVIRAVLGLGLLLGLDLFSIFLIWRQHRMLDEAREELQEMVRGELE